MSHFSNQLQASIEERGFSQIEITERIGVSQGQMSRYVNGENRPEPDVFAKLCEIFPKDERGKLIVAYLVDVIPPKDRSLIALELKKTEARVKEDAPLFRARMPKRLREAYDFLAGAALENPAIAQMLINTYDLTKPK